jgi:hypothetical protein
MESHGLNPHLGLGLKTSIVHVIFVAVSENGVPQNSMV